MDSNQVSLQGLHGVSNAVKTLADQAAGNVVSISSRKHSISGFLWKEGLVVTADEALQDGHDITVTLPDGTSAKADIAGRDPSTDVALLRLDASVSPVLVFTAKPAQFGSLVLVVGRDRNDPTAALGLVAKTGGRWQSMRGGDIDQRIELDMSLRGAQEGSMVLATDGSWLGMAVLGPRRRTLVIPAQTIDRVGTVLESKGRISRGYLGLGLQPVELSGEQGKGAIILNVDPKGPGSSAGLLQGDVIVGWNASDLPPLRTLLRSLGPQSVGKDVALRIHRAGEAREITLTIGERPAA
jgi:S1-C subfamily serine protease